MTTRPMSKGVCWSLRKDLRDVVRVMWEDESDEIGMSVDGQQIICDRATARLLAKRINQCLDATAKK